MKLKKICLSTQLSELYGKDNYQSHIEQNREYWGYFSTDSEISSGWHKIKVTYIRSGCVFYIFTDLPEVPERYFPINCFMASTLVFAEFDPYEDLPVAVDDFMKKMYCFDSEHTIIHNWSNEREIDVDKNEPEYFILNLMHT